MKLEEAMQNYSHGTEHTPEEYEAFAQGYTSAAHKLAHTMLVCGAVMFVGVKDPATVAQIRSGQALATLIAEADETLKDLGEEWTDHEIPTLEWKLAVRQAILELERMDLPQVGRVLEVLRGTL